VRTREPVFPAATPFSTASVRNDSEPPVVVAAEATTSAPAGARNGVAPPDSEPAPTITSRSRSEVVVTAGQMIRSGPLIPVAAAPRTSSGDEAAPVTRVITPACRPEPPSLHV